MALGTELTEKVEPLYREHQEREFGDHPVFDPITVELTNDEAGEEAFQVTIVCECAKHTVGPQKAARCSSRWYAHSRNWDSRHS